MSTFLLFPLILINAVTGCSPAIAPPGHYYISNVQLLDAAQYPDHVLLTIARSPEGQITNGNDKI